MKPEQREQIYLIDWSFLYPDIHPFLFYLVNDGKRTKIDGHIKKRMGLKPGVSDLFLSKPSKGYHGFYIELKTGNRKATKEQLDFLERMRGEGYKGEVIYGWVNAANAIADYLDKKIKIY